MTLDPRFIVTSDLESLYVDNATGLPLASGVINFYSDINRTSPKSVYIITGSAPNYTYSSIGSQITLTAAGKPQYNNISVLPYYFPYEGTPSNSSGEVELYYITIKNSAGVTQETRAPWPNFVSDNNGGEEFENLIPNGQFLAHNNNPPAAISEGSIGIKYIAQGGWQFRQTTGSTGVYAQTFITLPGSVGALLDIPRYALNFQCVSFGNETTHDLAITWADVNKFVSGNPLGSQKFTFFFAAQSLDAGIHEFDVRLIHNFGTGGSPSPYSDVSIGSFSINTSYAYYQLTVDFPSNAGMTIGTNNDDYVGICLRSPGSTCLVQFTDFAMQFGENTITSFPVQTNAQMLSNGVAGWMPTPNPDGSDLYLPLVLTPKGMTFDHSNIGKIYGSSYETLQIGELACDGGQYDTLGYSSNGIPYSRLQAKFVTGINIPLYGTGSQFVTCYTIGVDPDSQFLRIATNTAGLATVSADVSTTMTVSTLNAGTAGYGVSAYTTGASGIFIINNITGVSLDSAIAGTSGFTVVQSEDNAATRSTLFVTQIAAAGLAGKYFRFSNTSIAYYVWFKVDGAGADPSGANPGRTGILVNLLSTYDSVNTGRVIKEVLNGNQQTLITAIAATSIPQSSYFNMYVASGQQYYVWFNKDSAGTDPAPVNAIGIEVAITTGQTAPAVGELIQAAINNRYFAVPDMRGLFLRGFDPDAYWDYDSASRFNDVNERNVGNEFVGSLEYTQNIVHLHTAGALTAHVVTTDAGEPPGTAHIAAINNAGVATQPVVFDAAGSVSVSGGSQSNPSNMTVLWVIKY